MLTLTFLTSPFSFFLTLMLWVELCTPLHPAQRDTEVPIPGFYEHDHIGNRVFAGAIKLM